MHASPADFRAARRDGVVVHYAELADPEGLRVAFAVARFPAGSAGTFVEQPSSRARWGFVLRGSIEVELGSDRHDVPMGSAFHVPGGAWHRIRVAPGSRVAGFVPLGANDPTGDDAIRQAGFEHVPASASRHAHAAMSIARTRPEPAPDAGERRVEMRRMGDLLYTRTRLGRRAGYVGEPCDVPHWGIVVEGSVAIEWEDDIEVLAAGDVFLCPAGPPAHRIQAAEPALIVDFTPVDAFLTADRIAEWRRGPGRQALLAAEQAAGLEVAAL